jgi:hypothetical protein
MPNTFNVYAPIATYDIRAGAISTFDALCSTIDAYGSILTTCTLDVVAPFHSINIIAGATLESGSPFPTAQGVVGITSRAEGYSPFASAIGYTGAWLSQNAPVATASAQVNKVWSGTFAANSMFPSLSSTGLSGVVAVLGSNGFISTLSATGYISSVGTFAVDTPFPSLYGSGSIPYDFGSIVITSNYINYGYVVYGDEYGYIGKFDVKSMFPSIAGSTV